MGQRKTYYKPWRTTAPGTSPVVTSKAGQPRPGQCTKCTNLVPFPQKICDSCKKRAADARTAKLGNRPGKCSGCGRRMNGPKTKCAGCKKRDRAAWKAEE